MLRRVGGERRPHGAASPLSLLTTSPSPRANTQLPHEPGQPARPAERRHDPDPLHRRHPEGELGSPGPSARRGADGLRAVAEVPGARPDRSGLGRPRPVRAVRRARQHAALRAPAPDRVRALARRDQELPTVAEQDPRDTRSSGTRRVSSAPPAPRSGLRQRGRHGARRALAGPAVQHGRAHDRRPLDLGAGLRRGPDGGHQRRGGVARRAPGSRQAGLRLRLERHLPRRPDVDDLRRRRGGAALRGLRLARADRRRRGHGPRRPGDGARGGARGDRPPVARDRQDDDRLRLPQQGRLGGFARSAPGRGRGAPDQGGAGLVGDRAVPRPGRGSRAHGRGRARPRGAGGVAGALRRLGRGRAGARRRVARRAGGRAA